MLTMITVVELENNDHIFFTERLYAVTEVRVKCYTLLYFFFQLNYGVTNINSAYWQWCCKKKKLNRFITLQLSDTILAVIFFFPWAAAVLILHSFRSPLFKVLTAFFPRWKTILLCPTRFVCNYELLIHWDLWSNGIKKKKKKIERHIFHRTVY